jgi:putative endonuclease
LNFFQKLLSFFRSSSPPANINKGNLGEKLAKEYLEKKGFKILVRNYKVKGGEADIIASFEQKTIVVEVKTRTTRKFGPPQAAVDRRKFKRLVLAGTLYCRMKRLPLNSLRIDVIAIKLEKGKPSIRHFESVNLS